MNNKTKPDTDSLLRIPKLKNKLGLKINKIAMPHDDLISVEVPKLEIVPTPTTTNHPLPPRTTKQETPISPTRDFTKFANSIVRDAIPDGLFKGTSKNTYDALYQRTRGAIIPVRTIKVVQSDVLSWANVSHNTLRAHMKHLQSVGLIKIHYKLGDNKGQEYEVILPEEIGVEDDLSYHPLPPPTTTHNLGSPSNQNLLVGGGGLMSVNIGQDTSPKTSLKTIERNDDEAFADMQKVLSEISEKISGKSPAKNQKGNWKKLAELLAMELEIAAARTKSVSNVPAFLTEHLRRRLLGKTPIPKTSTEKAGTSKALKVGKSSGEATESVEEYQAEPLSKEGRETVLKTIREYLDKGQNEFIMSFQNTYIKEDWDWLMKELEKQ
ncbi:MAG TPA: hypothetical protein VNI60_00125 [Pyrinomonadaceae bacterium]|nr:hypothetical protein [Pyrinomonadaceae bacterium]